MYLIEDYDWEATARKALEIIPKNEHQLFYEWVKDNDVYLKLYTQNPNFGAKVWMISPEREKQLNDLR